MIFPRLSLEIIQKERLDLAEQKNNDYSSVIDVIGTTGIDGIAIRLFDKAARLLSLVKNKDQQVKDESIMDTLKDMGNYADFGVSILKNEWNDIEKTISNFIINQTNDLLEKVKNDPVNPVGIGNPIGSLQLPTKTKTMEDSWPIDIFEGSKKVISDEDLKKAETTINEEIKNIVNSNNGEVSNIKYKD